MNCRLTNWWYHQPSWWYCQLGCFCKKKKKVWTTCSHFIVVLHKVVKLEFKLILFVKIPIPFALVERSYPKMLENRLRNFTLIPLSNPMTISGRYKLHAFEKIRSGRLLPPSFTPCLQKSTVDKMQGITLIQFSRANITKVRWSHRDTIQQHGLAKKPIKPGRYYETPLSREIQDSPLVRAFHTLLFIGKRGSGCNSMPHGCKSTRGRTTTLHSLP